MSKWKITGIFLIGLIVSMGCTQFTSSEEIENVFQKTLERYSTINTFRATVISEFRNIYTEKIVVGEVKEGEKANVIEQEKIRLETKVTEKLYKKPTKIKVVNKDSNEITIINGEHQYNYNPRENTVCKRKSKLSPQQLQNYLTLAEEQLPKLYEIQYLGTEDIDGQALYVLKFIPKYEFDPLTNDELSEHKMWITQDFLISKAEYYDNDGNWFSRTTYKNIEVNTNIPDSVFEIPENAALLPKTTTYFTIEDARNDIEFEIKVPVSLPRQVELNSIEIHKECGQGSVVTISYFKENKETLTLILFKGHIEGTGILPESDLTGFDGPYEVEKQGVTLYYPAMVHGYKANYASANNTLIDWYCEATGVSYTVEDLPSKIEIAELEKMLNSFRCYE